MPAQAKALTATKRAAQQLVAKKPGKRPSVPTTILVPSAEATWTYPNAPAGYGNVVCGIAGTMETRYFSNLTTPLPSACKNGVMPTVAKDTTPDLRSEPRFAPWREMFGDQLAFLMASQVIHIEQIKKRSEKTFGSTMYVIPGFIKENASLLRDLSGERWVIRQIGLGRGPGSCKTVGVFDEEKKAREFASFWGNCCYSEVMVINVPKSEDCYSDRPLSSFETAWTQPRRVPPTLTRRKPLRPLQSFRPGC